MMNKEKNFVSAVIYVHNAAGRIENFLGMIISVLEENFEHSEIIWPQSLFLWDLGFRTTSARLKSKSLRKK